MIHPHSPLQLTTIGPANRELLTSHRVFCTGPLICLAYFDTGFQEGG